jgi:Rrf2 family protein
MRISSKAEYACLAIIDLATSDLQGRPKRIREIAEAHRIPKQYLMQILLQLKAAGLVDSARGTYGGYRLARSADQITIAEVIAAVDGRHELSLRGESPAARNLADLLIRARDAEQSVLASVSIADFAGQAALHDWVV